MKPLKPLVLTVSFKIEVDMNELLEGYRVNTSIGEARKNVTMFLKEEIANRDNQEPGNEFLIPDSSSIVSNLQEWDIVTSE